MLRVTGHFVFPRPLVELATVFDMTGLELTATPSGIRSEESRLRLDITASEGHRYSIEGAADPSVADAWLRRLATAFEADGIAHRFVLHDASGTPLCVFEGRADG